MGFSERLRALRYRFLCMGTYKYCCSGRGSELPVLSFLVERSSGVSVSRFTYITYLS